MRIHLRIEPSEAVLSHNYQPVLSSALHRWVGENEYHDSISLYSFSWLTGVQAGRDGIRFSDGGRFFVSSHQNELLEKLIKGIQNDPRIAEGLRVKEVIFQKEPNFKEREKLFTASPVLVKRKSDDGEKHYTFKDKESDHLLTQTLQTKLQKAGLDPEGVSVEFDRTYHAPKTKVIYYKSIGSRVNICPVIITGRPEQIAFAWNAGIGNSTGIGFGALK